MKFLLLIILAVAVLPVHPFEKELDNAIMEQTRLLDSEDEALIDEAEDAIFEDDEFAEELPPPPQRISDRIHYLERMFREERRKRIRLERGIKKLVKAFRLTTANIKSQHESKDQLYDFLKVIAGIIGTGGVTGLLGWNQLRRKTNKIKNGSG